MRMSVPVPTCLSVFFARACVCECVQYVCSFADTIRSSIDNTDLRVDEIHSFAASSFRNVNVNDGYITISHQSEIDFC